MLLLDVNIESLSLVSGNSERVILHDINFKIENGFIYTILGKNGSGKTTLIKSLTNLLFKNNYNVKGKVIFNGINILNADEEKLNHIRKNNIRYVFQDVSNSFDPLKKLNYYFNNFSTDRTKAEELLNYFLLPSFDNITKLYPYELSGGMLQRLSLIFALLANPDLIILDEPTSGIDYGAINLVLIKLNEFTKKQNKSVLILTQDIKFANASSNFIAMIDKKTLTTFVSTQEFFKTELSEDHKTILRSIKELE